VNKSKHKSNRLRHSLFIWHRYIGITVALIVVLLSLTGLLLNHTETFNLDEKRVQSDLILGGYGLKLTPPKISFAAGRHWISKIEEQIYFDAIPLPFKSPSSLIGAIKTEQTIAIALSDEIVLITEDGDLIERITSAQDLPDKILRIGTNSLNQPMIDSSKGILQSEDGLLSWRASPDQKSQWSHQSTMPAALSEEIAQHFRYDTIPLERFILDLHSGRFFGPLGVFIVDFATLMFIFLAFSGFLLWLRQTRHNRRRK
jgi:hypothetical protein